MPRTRWRMQRAWSPVRPPPLQPCTHLLGSASPGWQVIGATSSLTYNVVGHVKTVLILSGGVAFFGDTMPPKKAAGILAAMGGIVWWVACPALLAAALQGTESRCRLASLPASQHGAVPHPAPCARLGATWQAQQRGSSSQKNPNAHVSALLAHRRYSQIKLGEARTAAAAKLLPVQSVSLSGELPRLGGVSRVEGGRMQVPVGGAGPCCGSQMQRGV